MGEIKVSVPDEKEEKFRKAAMEVFGHKRGSISKAAEKAMDEWAERMSFETDVKMPEDPVEFLEGNMAGIEESGVELQEQASEVRSDEVSN
jgi:hypothetical protein